MAADVAAALSGRGTATAQLTPSIDALIQELQIPVWEQTRPAGTTAANYSQRPGRTGAPGHDRRRLRRPAHRRPQPLKHPEDLVTRLSVLEDGLRSAGRTVSALLENLGQILRNNQWSVNLAHRRLGSAVTIERDDMYRDAGLTLEQRSDVCRELLRQPDAPTHNVVRLCYDHARIRLSSIVCGPITFYDGAALVDALANSTPVHHDVDHGDGSHGFAVTPVCLQAALAWLG
jgi:hypothetical protein